MPWGAVVGGLLTAGGAVAAADSQKDASKDAANAQTRASENAVANEAGMYNAGQALLGPTRQLGGLGQSRMAYLLGLTPNLDIRSSFATPSLDPKTGSVTWTGIGAGGIANSNGIAATSYTGQQGSRAVPGSIPADSGTGVSVQPDGSVRASGNQSLVTGARTNNPNAPAVVDPSTGIPNPNAILSGDDYGSFARPFSMDDFDADPGYQFRQQQGEDTINRINAANGLSGSGAAIKDALEFNSGLASQEYGAAFDRARTSRLDQWNMLAGITGAGQVANNTAISAGDNTVSGVNNALFGGANAQAAAAIAGGNADAGAYQGIAKGLGSTIGAGVDLYNDRPPPAQQQTKVPT